MILSYSYKTAAEASGYSEDIIKKAVRAGNLAVVKPRIDNRQIAKPVILAAELQRWLEDGAA